VTIPGFATITLGSSITKKGPHGAGAWANGLKVELAATHSLVRVAHAKARISDGVRHGLFRGNSSALGGNAVGGVLDVGRTPLSLLPCQGTRGQIQKKALVGLDLGGQVDVGALTSEQMANQNAKRSWGFERGKVASITLGDGALKIDGVVGQANVSRAKGKVVRSARGTTIGRVTFNGQRQTFPDTGVLEIPGIAKLQPKVVTKTRNGIKVVGLRITLLDGTGAVLELGQANLAIGASGR
jgi:hypothetical protein